MIYSVHIARLIGPKTAFTVSLSRSKLFHGSPLSTRQVEILLSEIQECYCICLLIISFTSPLFVFTLKKLNPSCQVCEKVICELSYHLSILWPLNKDCALSKNKNKNTQKKKKFKNAFFSLIFHSSPVQISLLQLFWSHSFFPNMTSICLHLHFYSSFPTCLNALPLFSHCLFPTQCPRPLVALVVKNLPFRAGDLRDMGLIPGSGRSLEEGNGNPLQYSCLENPMDRGAWLAMVHSVAKSRTRLK